MDQIVNRESSEAASAYPKHKFICHVWLESFVTWRPWSHRLVNCCFWQDKSLHNNAVGFVGLLNGRACCFCAIVTESANWIAKSVQTGAVRRQRLKVIEAVPWYIVYRWINVARFCNSFWSWYAPRAQEPTVHALHDMCSERPWRECLHC